MTGFLKRLLDVGAARDYRIATERAQRPATPRLTLVATTLPPGAEPRDWRAAHAMFGHTRDCYCSTCTLAVTLAVAIRQREQK